MLVYSVSTQTDRLRCLRVRSSGIRVLAIENLSQSSFHILYTKQNSL
jgi:hypothetical protein